MQTEAPSRTNPEAASAATSVIRAHTAFPKRSGCQARPHSRVRTDLPSPPRGRPSASRALRAAAPRASGRRGSPPRRGAASTSLSTTGAVEPLDREAASAVGAHPGDERGDRRPQPLGVGLAQREQRAAAALDVERRLAAEQHDVRARDAGRTGGGPLRPRQDAAVGLRRIGGREHERLVVAASRSSRSRSTAPGSANCAPPSPSTK